MSAENPTGTGPPEHPDGQDDPPDIRQALIVAILLIREMHDRLEVVGGIGDEDLILRAKAMINVGDRIPKET